MGVCWPAGMGCYGRSSERCREAEAASGVAEADPESKGQRGVSQPGVFQKF